MNSKNSWSRLLAAALCAMALAGCNAVEDVPDEPAAATPLENVVLGGKIKDLGTRRPLVLQLNGKDACLVPVNVADPNSLKVISECRFFGVSNQQESLFSMSAINAEAFPRLTVGEGYTLSVKRQPYGKICLFANGTTTLTGTLQVNERDIEINCSKDPAVNHFTVTVNTAAVATRPGLRVILATENGTCPVDVNGRTSITFAPEECPNNDVTGYHQNATYIFNNPPTALPNFQWKVTASVPGDTVLAPRKNCFLTGGPVANTGGNTNDNPNSFTDLGDADTANKPTGPVSVTVASCGFTVRAQADYSLNPGITTVPAIAVGDGITVALRSQPWGTDVAVARITSFANTYVPFMVPDASGNPTATVFDAPSDANAFYELVVKSSPAGMACHPGYSTTTGSQGSRNIGTSSDAGAVLLRRPSSGAVANLWLIDRMIRCRLTPASTAARLRGGYWQFVRTTTTTTVGAEAPTVTSPTVMNRNLLALFEDGTYLLGSHSGTVGVEQGFYNYNATSAVEGTQAGNSIIFVPTTDTNGGSGINSSAAIRTITSVVKAGGTPETITARVSNTTTNGIAVAAGQLTITVGGGLANNVASATYTTANLATLVANINTASNPGNVVGFPVIASIAPGGEILITAPAGSTVGFTGSAVATLGLPTLVAGGASATSTNVARTLATTVNVIVDWILSEVGPDPLATTTSSALDGAWVAWDWDRQPAPAEYRQRIFAYQHSLYNSMHVGVNGISNMQEACYVDEIGTAGLWVKQSTRSTAGAGSAASAGCSMRQYSVAQGETLQDLLSINRGCGAAPFYAPFTSTCTLLSATAGDFPASGTVTLPDFPGRWPQSQSQDSTDGRPVSVVEYQIRAANSDPSDPVCPTRDKLTVWDTQNGVRKDTLIPAIPRIVLCRLSVN